MSEAVTVRDVCVCGKAYRVRRARAGFTFKCPQCGRSITLTAADIELAAPDFDESPRLINPADTADANALLEARPIGDDELRLAPRGAARGATGRVAFDTGEAQLMSARNPSLGLTPDWVASPLAGQPRGKRAFLLDLLSTFYAAGVPRNQWILAATAAGMAVPWMLASVLPFPLSLFMSAVAIVATLFTVQFYWQVLQLTATGEDEMPWVESNWGWWDDVLRPLLFMLLLSFLCGLPASIADAYLPPGAAYRAELVWAVRVVGFLFFPVGVMSVAIGGSIWYLRPDLLVRCIVAIGPVYLLPCAVVVLAMVAARRALDLWLRADALAGQGGVIAMKLLGLFGPVVMFMVIVYLGYVAFRTMGLLYRHFHERFPWRFD